MNEMCRDAGGLPLISVITVVFNGAETISDTLRSVASQTYGNYEYVVVDGGSSDGTLDIVREYGEFVDRLVSEKDEGISDAFNKGLRLAKGDYLLFLNADDALSGPEVLAEVARLIVKHNRPMMLYGGFRVLDRVSKVEKRSGGIVLTRNGILHGQMLPHPCLFTSKEYFEKYGGFDISFKVAMDYDWFLRGAFRERVVREGLCISDVSDGGVSTRDRALAVEEIIRALKRNGYYKGWLGSVRIRAYFGFRALARDLLSMLGCYGLYRLIGGKRDAKHEKLA